MKSQTTNESEKCKWCNLTYVEFGDEKTHIKLGWCMTRQELNNEWLARTQQIKLNLLTLWSNNYSYFNKENKELVITELKKAIDVLFDAPNKTYPNGSMTERYLQELGSSPEPELPLPTPSFVGKTSSLNDGGTAQENSSSAKESENAIRTTEEVAIKGLLVPLPSSIQWVPGKDGKIGFWWCFKHGNEAPPSKGSEGTISPACPLCDKESSPKTTAKVLDKGYSDYLTELVTKNRQKQRDENVLNSAELVGGGVLCVCGHPSRMHNCVKVQCSHKDNGCFLFCYQNECCCSEFVVAR